MDCWEEITFNEPKIQPTPNHRDPQAPQQR